MSVFTAAFSTECLVTSIIQLVMIYLSLCRSPPYLPVLARPFLLLFALSVPPPLRLMGLECLVSELASLCRALIARSRDVGARTDVPEVCWSCPCC